MASSQSKMPRLTKTLKFPLDTFLRCQLCGYGSPREDICEFRMWYECDDADHPETDKVLVACKKCEPAIIAHARGYQQVEWGMGAPGHFILVCGSCVWRKGIDCTHAKLKKNGGEGLEVKVSRPLGDIMVCVCGHDETDGRSLHCEPMFSPVTSCEGFADKDGANTWPSRRSR